MPIRGETSPARPSSAFKLILDGGKPSMALDGIDQIEVTENDPPSNVSRMA